MKNLALIIVMSIFSMNALAQDTYVCLFGDAERKISVVYNSPTSTVPCEVIYEKDSGTQSLWKAHSEEGYCETQAAKFVEKQKNWGWDCAKMNETLEEVTDATDSTNN